MQDIQVRLNALRARAEQGRTEKAKAEATIESLRKQEEQIVAEIRALGIDPEGIDTEIARLDAEIQASLEQAEALLPR